MTPQPVFQLVTGPGSTGEALARSGVAKIAFTGSAATARKVMAAAADTLTPVLAECGGKDALLVSADADLDAAADAAAWGAMSNAGQTCIGIERVYVADAVYHSFLERLTDRVSGLRPGFDSEASYGPMTLPSQPEIVAKHMADALARGGRLGGGRRGRGGGAVRAAGDPDGRARAFGGGDRGDVRADGDGDVGGEPGRGGLVRQRGALRAGVGGVRSRSFGRHDRGTLDCAAG